MKLLKKWFNVIAAVALAAGSFTLCACGEEEEPDEPTVLKVNPTSISLISAANASTTLSIVCSDSWSVTERPDWVNLSSTSGNGNTSVVVTAISANETSKPRTGNLVVTSRDLRAVVELTQLAGLQNGCEVTITDEVILHNCATFELSFGSKASYFYAGYFPASSAGWSDDRLLSALITDEPLNAENGTLISTSEGLYANTNYIQCFVAYDSNGKRGDIIRLPFTTPQADRTKSPQVYLKEFKYNASYWTWLTEKNATTTDYFMFAISGDWAIEYYYATTSLIGMIIKETADYENSFVNGQYWQLARDADDEYLYVATWARREQKWSPMIVDQIVWVSGATPVYGPAAPEVKQSTVKDGQFSVLTAAKRAEMQSALKVIKL